MPGNLPRKWRKVKTEKGTNSSPLPNRFVEYAGCWNERVERCRDWRSMEPSEWAKKYT